MLSLAETRVVCTNSSTQWPWPWSQVTLSENMNLKNCVLENKKCFDRLLRWALQVHKSTLIIWVEIDLCVVSLAAAIFFSFFFLIFGKIQGSQFLVLFSGNKIQFSNNDVQRCDNVCHAISTSWIKRQCLDSFANNFFTNSEVFFLVFLFFRVACFPFFSTFTQNRAVSFLVKKC